ncbi:MAG TPA: transglutaminase-like domain-containing protein [Ilumatobacteraceae bacterium]|nr:transglutaminase-like domain-containing protein [Ilumatobacteraceae bacterium]
MDRDDVTGAIEAFSSLVARSYPDLPLDRTALTLAAVLRPGLDTEHALRDLDGLAASCQAGDRDGVVAELFGGTRFMGDRSTYSDWRNSCLDHVLDTGRGIPITLSVLLIEVARRRGIDLVGIGMPAHFLVGDPHDPEWFVDPFNSGRTLDRAACEALLRDLTRDQVPWRPSHLDPVPARAIIVRMLNNLRAGFEQRGDRVRLALVMRMWMAVPELGEDAAAIRALAVLN